MKHTDAEIRRQLAGTTGAKARKRGNEASQRARRLRQALAKPKAGK